MKTNIKNNVVTRMFFIFLTVVLQLAGNLIYNENAFAEELNGTNGMAESLNTLNPADKPVHLIIPIHGLRGDEKSFADFPQLVKQHLQRIDNSYEVVTFVPTYNLTNPSFDQFEVTEELNQQILEQVKHLHEGSVNGPTGLRDHDIISVLLYSMGGNVALPWLTQTLNPNYPNHDKYVNIVGHLKNFISLGAPFWGSLEAGNTMELISKTNSKEEVSKVLENSFIKGITKFNIDQLDTLAVSGKNSAKVRDQFISTVVNPELSKVLAHINFINLVGLLPCTNLDIIKAADSEYLPNVKVDYDTDCKVESEITKGITDIFGKTLFSAERRETDMVVPAPSATVDFFFKTPMQNSFERTGQFLQTNLEKRYVQMTHATLNVEKVDDFVIIKKEFCEGDKIMTQKCNRIYKYLLWYLTSKEVRKESAFLNQIFICDNKVDTQCSGVRGVEAEDAFRQKQLRGFLMDFNLKIPKSVLASLSEADLKQLKSISSLQILKNIQFPFVLNNGQASNKEDHLITDIFHKISDIKTVLTNEKLDGLIQLNQTNPAYYIQIARSLQVGSSVVRVFEADPNYMEIHVTFAGRVMPEANMSDDQFQKEIANGVEIPDVTVSLPGLGSQVVRPMVKPGLSTFIEMEFH